MAFSRQLFRESVPLKRSTFEERTFRDRESYISVHPVSFQFHMAFSFALEASHVLLIICGKKNAALRISAL
jgi:hypothetical protein